MASENKELPRKDGTPEAIVGLILLVGGVAEFFIDNRVAGAIIIVASGLWVIAATLVETIRR
jgi:hypothetical protein